MVEFLFTFCMINFHGLLCCVLQDFYQKDCWAHHPMPYADFIDFKKKERADLEAEKKKLVRV